MAKVKEPGPEAASSLPLSPSLPRPGQLRTGVGRLSETEGIVYLGGIR